MASSSKNFSTEAREIWRIISEPLRDFWSGFSKLNRPELIVKSIMSDQVGISDLVKYMIGSALISALISAVLPVEEGILELVEIPLLNELLVVSVFVIGGLLNTLFIYKPLRLAGGVGAFRHTFMAEIYTVVTCYPILTLIEGIANSLGLSLTGATYAAPAIVYASQLLSQIHGLSYRKMLLFHFALSFGLLLVSLVFLFAFL